MLSKKIVLLIVLSLFLMGCRTAPVQDFNDMPINTSSGKKPALSKVTQDIIQAGNSLGWQMKKGKPGHITATLNLRKHMAKVDINYSKTDYSIHYKDSRELRYDGANIHSNYNSWVQNLSNAISTQVYNQN